MGTIDIPSCPTCKKSTAVRKLLRAPMVHFKGSGFYKTDSSKSVITKSKETSEPKVADPKPTETKTEAKPAEAKAPETKSEPKK